MKLYTITPPQWLKLLYGRGFLWAVKTNNKEVYLTFDDGPSPEYTNRLLDLLKIYNQKATFFIVGKRAVKYPEIIQRIVDEGHELGNHSYNHFWSNELTYEEQEVEIDKTQEVLIEIVGEKHAPKFFRAPYGRMTGNIKLLLYRKKMSWANWSYTSDDWDSKTNSEAIINKVISFDSPQLMLFHDDVEPHPTFINKEVYCN